jgi:hypothetical protein
MSVKRDKETCVVPADKVPDGEPEEGFGALEEKASVVVETVEVWALTLPARSKAATV